MPRSEPVNPFEYLGSEHRELTQVLGVLETMSKSAACGEMVDRADLRGVVDYFSEFGDMGHHDKEETLLVPMLVRYNMSWYDGPLADLRREHRQERYLMSNLRDAARQHNDWSDETRRHFVAMADAYAEFLRRHMAKESNEWFRQAAEILPAKEQKALVESFEHLDAELRELEGYQAICERARALVTKYSPR
jgi:hemerythrin-like domain-containing protein